MRWVSQVCLTYIPPPDNDMDWAYNIRTGFQYQSCKTKPWCTRQFTLTWNEPENHSIPLLDTNSMHKVTCTQYSLFRNFSPGPQSCPRQALPWQGPSRAPEIGWEKEEYHTCITSQWLFAGRGGVRRRFTMRGFSEKRNAEPLWTNLLWIITLVKEFPNPPQSIRSCYFPNIEPPFAEWILGAWFHGRWLEINFCSVAIVVCWCVCGTCLNVIALAGCWQTFAFSDHMHQALLFRKVSLRTTVHSVFRMVLVHVLIEDNVHDCTTLSNGKVFPGSPSVYDPALPVCVWSTFQTTVIPAICTCICIPPALLLTSPACSDMLLVTAPGPQARPSSTSSNSRWPLTSQGLWTFSLIPSCNIVGPPVPPGAANSILLWLSSL